MKKPDILQKMPLFHWFFVGANQLPGFFIKIDKNMIAIDKNIWIIKSIFFTSSSADHIILLHNVRTL